MGFSWAILISGCVLDWCFVCRFCGSWLIRLPPLPSFVLFLGYGLFPNPGLWKLEIHTQAPRRSQSKKEPSPILSLSAIAGNPDLLGVGCCQALGLALLSNPLKSTIRLDCAFSHLMDKDIEGTEVKCFIHEFCLPCLPWLLAGELFLPPPYFPAPCCLPQGPPSLGSPPKCSCEVVSHFPPQCFPLPPKMDWEIRSCAHVTCELHKYMSERVCEWINNVLRYQVPRWEIHSGLWVPGTSYPVSLFTAININSLGPIPAGKSSNITETIFRNLFRPCWLQPNQPFWGCCWAS